MRTFTRRAAGLALAVLFAAAAGWAQPTAAEDEKEVDSLVDDLEAKMDNWERRPAEREVLEDDIQNDLDRLGLFYQNRFTGMLGRRGFAWRSRRTLGRTHRLLNRASGFRSTNGQFNTSIAGALISFGGVLGQPGVAGFGRPRAAASSFARAGWLLRGVHSGGGAGFGRSSTMLTGLNGRMSSFSRFGWFQPEIYGFGRLGNLRAGAQQPKQEPPRAPLPDRPLGEIVDDYLVDKRDGIAEAVANMPTPGATPSADDLLNRYSFLEDKAGKMWGQVSELNYRLAAEGHSLQADTVAWAANLQVALEEAAAGLDNSDLDLANRGIRRGEFELTRLAKVVGR